MQLRFLSWCFSHWGRFRFEPALGLHELWQDCLFFAKAAETFRDGIWLHAVSLMTLNSESLLHGLYWTQHSPEPWIRKLMWAVMCSQACTVRISGVCAQAVTFWAPLTLFSAKHGTVCGHYAHPSSWVLSQATYANAPTLAMGLTLKTGVCDEVVLSVIQSPRKGIRSAHFTSFIWFTFYSHLLNA